MTLSAPIIKLVTSKYSWRGTMNTGNLLNHSKPFVIFAVLVMFTILFFSPLAANTSGSTVYNVSSVELSITNKAGKSIEHMCIESNYESQIAEFNNLEPGETVKGEYTLPYIGEGGATLCYMDAEGNTHQELLIGYLMPSHRIQVIVLQADTDDFVISVTEE